MIGSIVLFFVWLKNQRRGINYTLKVNVIRLAIALFVVALGVIAINLPVMDTTKAIAGIASLFSIFQGSKAVVCILQIVK
jgi:hypothetical protein